VTRVRIVLFDSYYPSRLFLGSRLARSPSTRSCCSNRGLFEETVSHNANIAQACSQHTSDNFHTSQLRRSQDVSPNQAWRGIQSDPFINAGGGVLPGDTTAATASKSRQCLFGGSLTRRAKVTHCRRALPLGADLYHSDMQERNKLQGSGRITLLQPVRCGPSCSVP